MCEEKKSYLNPNISMLLAIGAGVCAGLSGYPIVADASQEIADLFIGLLKLVSLPIIFLSIVSTASSMGSVAEIRVLGKKVLKYTLLTTILAATVALGLFIVIDPVRGQIAPLGNEVSQIAGISYFHYLKQVIPSNFMKPFIENNVIGVLFLAMLLSLSILALPEKNRTLLHGVFSSLFQAVMKITTWIVAFIPIATAAFVVLFIRDMKAGLDLGSIGFYLLCVVGANLIQATVVLPILLKMKGIKPLQLAHHMRDALTVAFWTKSSAAALPTAVKCAEENAGISRKIAGFSLPLCTTINMNGCAAFILITVLFVSMSQGLVISYAEMVGWIFIATLAAVGNAGVPMGCFFLASAFLASMNVPLNILGVILPFYALIDMIETAINVWSDSCVTAIVDKESKAEAIVPHGEYVLSSH